MLPWSSSDIVGLAQYILNVLVNWSISFHSEEDRAAKEAEVSLLMDEVERAQARLVSLEREKVALQFAILLSCFCLHNFSMWMVLTCGTVSICYDLLAVMFFTFRNWMGFIPPTYLTNQPKFSWWFCIKCSGGQINQTRIHGPNNPSLYISWETSHIYFPIINALQCDLYQGVDLDLNCVTSVITINLKCPNFMDSE